MSGDRGTAKGQPAPGDVCSRRGVGRFDVFSILHAEQPLDGHVQDFCKNGKLIIGNEPRADLNPADAVPFNHDSFNLQPGSQVGLREPFFQAGFPDTAAGDGLDFHVYRGGRPSLRLRGDVL